ncbi:MAG TPA: tetratricopeptide repeat protein [Chthoniobacter sp.]|nr:tetratricopeptide repeat protein [Chthoniobacter sp.]
MPPVTIPQALELALQHHEAGRLREAEVIYRQILAVQPDHAEAHHLLGVIAHHCGQNEAAAELIQSAINLGLDGAAVRSNLGEAFRGLGRLDEAIAAYGRALEIDPQFSAAHYNLGLVLKARGQTGEAVEAFRRAIETSGGHRDADRNLATCLMDLGRMEEALAVYRCVLRLAPDAPESSFDLGVVLSRLGRTAEAVLAYGAAIRLQPDFPEALNNLGAALVDERDWDGAVTILRRATVAKPDYAQAHYNLGNALQGKGALDAAADSYERAIELNSQYAAAWNNLGNIHATQGRLKEAALAFQRATECPGAEASVYSNLCWVLLFMPDAGEADFADAESRWNRQFSHPVKGRAQPHANQRNTERRLRVGYVSADFRDHTMGRNLMPLFQHHDRRKVEVICYSGVPHPDALTEEFRQRADHWRGTVDMSDTALAEVIRKDEVDILVDLSLHTAGNRLPVFAQMSAPVQVSFAGYPGGTGVQGIGYRISDRYLEDCLRDDSIVSASSGRGEAVCLVDSFWCYDPCGMEVPVNGLPVSNAGYITLGSLNAFRKVNEPMLELWARVMMAVKDSRLLLLSAQGRHRLRVMEVLRKGGVAEDRVEFVEPKPRRQYLELYHRVDVMLDSFPYGGHTTILDAMWMGVPVVSLAGGPIVSRAGLSQLSNLGLRELVAFTADEYVKIAVELARDLPRLENLRETLRSRMEASVLMDGERFARGIEGAYRAMWRRWCEGDDASAKVRR